MDLAQLPRSHVLLGKGVQWLMLWSEGKLQKKLLLLVVVSLRKQKFEKAINTACLLLENCYRNALPLLSHTQSSSENLADTEKEK